jgi:class 3 adenylate cyclase
VLNQANTDYPLAIHLGLNSGIALVGATRLEGLRGTHWTFTASGPVTNLAARLASVAQAGQIVVGPETVRRLNDRYHVVSLGRERLKNIAEAIEVYQVVGRAV